VIIDKAGSAGYPCYVPSDDIIFQPPQENFNSAENYYSTLAHEMVHSTAAKTRLNRRQKKFNYAFEELIAEMGACFLCANLGIKGNLENHASYLDSWLRALKDDKTMIYKAANYAQKACRYLQAKL
jgi:antirestriction protein ArdC